MTPPLNLEATHRLGPRAFMIFWTHRAHWPFLALLALGVAWFFEGRVQFLAAYHFQALFVFEIVFAIVFGLFALATMRAFFEYRGYAYRFENEFFRLSKGYIARQEIGVVYHQIQTVTLRHNFLDRSMGITHLVIVMTGGRENPSEVILPAIDHKKARQVQEELLRQARIRSGFAAPAHTQE